MTKRRRLTALAATTCALAVILAPVAGAAATEPGDSAPLRPLSDGGFNFPEITGPSAPEEYPFELAEESPEIRVRQIDDQKVVGEYIEGGYTAWSLEAGPAHDADGATVPTSVKLTEEDIVTLIVHHRAGNPAAGGASFVYPITGGEGWEGGYFSGTVEMSEPNSPASTPSPSAPAVICTVPFLRGLSLRAAKAGLRAAHCTIGRVRLGHKATAAKGKVVKQSHAPGAQLAAGSPVAVKLGPR